MKLAALEYLILFDPADGWSHSYQFEETFADYLAAYGKEANIIKLVEGGSGKRMIYIRKIQPMISSPKSPVGRPKETKAIINGMREHKMSTKERDFRKGSLVPSKGYIKK